MCVVTSCCRRNKIRNMDGDTGTRGLTKAVDVNKAWERATVENRGARSKGRGAQAVDRFLLQVMRPGNGPSI